ncbi:GGDEF domain-containing protein [Paraburkholderia rhizosphaerae]|uniref:diguanylate cyclase n=1 Tax=Paraburkholderia rhizosphaerae TaxID=480658 RepID=A0A4V3HCF9_9BURK|nr:GGDEF domain-containing protein [Paraburkholderia rhizosphaerae]TDY37034.1 diguanylate cyclase (GGDEF)-like protein [Paraburkholderia rhizosphaerae]
MISHVAPLFIAATSGVVSVAILGSLLRAGIPGLTRWLSANLLAAGALIFLAFQGHMPGGMCLAITTAVLIYAVLLVLQGCRQFFGLRPFHYAELAAYVVLLACVVQWTTITPNANIRIMLVSPFLAYARLSFAWIVWHYRPQHRPRYAYNFVFWTALVEAAIHAARGLAFGLGWEHQTAAVISPTPTNDIFAAMVVLATPCLSVGIVMLAHDRMAERMERLATVDELTGALARRAFFVLAQQRFDAALRDRTVLSVAILDLDRFKTFNDEHGHATGDAVLKTFAGVAIRALGRDDLFGRLGGEEFAIVFRATSQADAAQWLDKLRGAVAASPVTVPDGERVCTFSAGVSELQRDDTLARLMARADAAQYAAKAMGRNRVVIAADTAGSGSALNAV